MVGSKEIEGETKTETAESLDSVPEGEVVEVTEKDVGKVSDVLGTVEEAEEKTLPDWSPLENPNIMARLDKLAASLFDLKGIEAYKNTGTSNYVGFRTKPRRGVAFVYLSEKSARISIGEAVEEGGKIKGTFPKKLIGVHMHVNDEEIQLAPMWEEEEEDVPR